MQNYITMKIFNMKPVKLNTDVQITYNKNGNIKTITTPYDDCDTMQPINANAIANELTLRNLFTQWGNDFLTNQNN